MTKQASKILKKNIKKYQHKSERLANRRKPDLEKSKQYSILAKSFTTKLKDIDEGKLKAGRDFVVNYRYTNYHIPKSWYNVTYSRIIDFK